MKLRIALVILAVLATFISTPFFDRSVGAEEEISPWLGITDIPFESTDINSTDVPLFRFGFGSYPCSSYTFTMRPWTTKNMSTGTAYQIPENCPIMTPYGLSSGNIIEYNNTSIAGKFAWSFGAPKGVGLIPNSSMVMETYSGANNGRNINFYPNYLGTLTPWVHSTTKEVQYREPAALSWWRLNDKAGNALSTYLDSKSFSSNGDWMVIEAINKAFIRVNLNTGDVLPFGSTMNHPSNGTSVSVSTAISSDGRYAAVYASSPRMFRLYDLSTCAVVPNTITGPVTCEYRDIYSFLDAHFTNFRGIKGVNFLTNHTMDFYGVYGTSVQYAHVTMAAPGYEISRLDYLALGDSFASGEGAYEYRADTDTDDNRCHLSTISYAYLISQSEEINSFGSIACSGARMNDLLNQEEDYKGQAKDGIPLSNRNLTSILNNFLPGYAGQSKFVDSYKPSIVTLSLGGNDIGFADIIINCVMPGTCYATHESRLEKVREINTRFAQLVKTYQDVKASAAPNAKVYVTGYPQLAASGGSCGLNVHLNEEEIAFSRLLVDYLNQVIEQAALKAGVRYVDVTDALAGQQLCETVDYMTAVNGLTAGNDQLFGIGPIGNESYHPNEIGHRLLKEKILEETANFTLGNPTANSAATYPSETGLEILDAPSDGSTVREARIKQFIEQVSVPAYLNGSLNIETEELTPILQPGTSYQVLLHSDPASLGSGTVDGTGNISFAGAIPSSVDPGIHTLHILGTNVAGEAVDLYQSIYVAASAADYDGDGIFNSNDQCHVVDMSMQDFDKDGNDDACDGYIGLQPEEQEETPPQEDDTPLIANDLQSTESDDGGNNDSEAMTARASSFSDFVQNGNLDDLLDQAEAEVLAESGHSFKDDTTANTPWILLAIVASAVLLFASLFRKLQNRA